MLVLSILASNVKLCNYVHNPPSSKQHHVTTKNKYNMLMKVFGRKLDSHCSISAMNTLERWVDQIKIRLGLKTAELDQGLRVLRSNDPPYNEEQKFPVCLRVGNREIVYPLTITIYKIIATNSLNFYSCNHISQILHSLPNELLLLST